MDWSSIRRKQESMHNRLKKIKLKGLLKTFQAFALSDSFILMKSEK